MIENFAPAVALLIPSALTSEVTALTVAPIGLDRAIAISRILAPVEPVCRERRLYQRIAAETNAVQRAP